MELSEDCWGCEGTSLFSRLMDPIDKLFVFDNDDKNCCWVWQLSFDDDISSPMRFTTINVFLVDSESVEDTFEGCFVYIRDDEDEDPVVPADNNGFELFSAKVFFQCFFAALCKDCGGSRSRRFSVEVGR
jgi:hypothetical protein